MITSLNTTRKVNIMSIEQIEARRKQLGLSARQVAEMSGLTLRTYQNYIYHVSKLKPQKALRIEGALLQYEMDMTAHIDTILTDLCGDNISDDLKSRLVDVKKLICEVNGYVD